MAGSLEKLVTGRYSILGCGTLRQVEFQSSPGLVTGRYATLQVKVKHDGWFQSSPGLVTGRYGRMDYSGGSHRSFNPRPVW